MRVMFQFTIHLGCFLALSAIAGKGAGEDNAEVGV